MREFLLRLKVSISHFQWYWRTNTALRNLRFSFDNLGFKSRQSFFEGLSYSSILRNIFSASAPKAIWALGIGVLTVGLTSYLQGLSSSTGYLYPEIVNRVISTVPEQQYDAYDNFLIAIITVTGIFLTLYLTNLNTITGTLYARLPNKLRDLVVDDIVGNTYINYLINLTLLSLVFLGYGVITSYRPIWIVVVITVGGLLAIPAFLRLSSRSFSLYDPTSLAGSLFWKLDRWVKLSTINGYKWDDSSFQSHYQKQASATVSAVSMLVETAHEENTLKKEPLSFLIRNINNYLLHYLPHKKLIPSESIWYERKPKYQNWFLSNSPAIALATQTQTDVRPELEPHREWVETEVFGINARSLERSLEEGSTSVALTVLDSVAGVHEVLGSEWELSFALEQLAKFSLPVKNYLDKSTHSISQYAEKPEQFKQNIALSEYMGLLPLNLLLGLSNQLEKFDLGKLATSLEKIDWSNHKSIYQIGLPSSCLKTLEDILTRLKNENVAEGKVITPSWYIRQLVFQSLAFSLQKQLEQLVNNSSDLYMSATNWKDKDHILYGVTLAIRAGEFRNKYFAHLQNFKSFVETLDKGRIEKDIPWPIWDWESWANKIDSLFNDLTVYYAESIQFLTEYSDLQDFPDYLGRAVHMVGEECFRALHENNKVKFSKIFQHYFLGILSELGNLSKKTEGWNKESAVIANTQPVLDLCELSGYCYLFSELFQDDESWKECKRVWERYLRPEVRIERLKWLDAVLSLNSYYSFLLTERDTFRTQWEMAVTQKLNSLKRTTLPTSARIPLFRHVVDHPSILVKVMAGSSEMMISFYKGLDIFTDLFLRSYPEASDMKFGSRLNLDEAMKRHKEKEMNGIDDEYE